MHMVQCGTPFGAIKTPDVRHLGLPLGRAIHDPSLGVIDCRGEVFPDLAFPHHRYSPAQCEQCIDVSLIAFHVLAEFSLPELRSGCWRGCILATFMAVPETAMNEYGRAKYKEYH